MGVYLGNSVFLEGLPNCLSMLPLVMGGLQGFVLEIGVEIKQVSHSMNRENESFAVIQHCVSEFMFASLAHTRRY